MAQTGSASHQHCSRHREALSLMERALNLLDESDDALHAAAHLDLAIERLREFIGTSSNSEPKA